MATKPKHIRKTRDQLSLAAVTGPASALTYNNQVLRERPTLSTNLGPVFTRLRVVAAESSFLTSYLPLKQAFYHYGFEVALGPQATADEEALTKWLATEFKTDVEYTDPNRQTTKIEVNQTYAEAIRNLVADVWREYLLLDNCVLQWFDGSDRTPVTLGPESCRYIDKLGLPILYYTHGLSQEEILLLPQEQQERFRSNPEILLSPDEGEHFKVLKRGLLGTGFAKPGLYSMLRTFGEIDAKEVGFHGQAYNMRAATRHHRLGHEIKQGTHAGKGTWFWNKKRDVAVRAEWNNRQGPHDFTSNFDHAVEYPWPEVERFDETAWKGTNLRLRNWGGPVAQMLISETVVEGGLNFLRAQANEDRLSVANLVRPAIQQVFRPPDGLDLQLTWSDLIFCNPAQAAELLKFAVQQGPASVQTFREYVGLNDARENRQKLREADAPDGLKKFLPAFDLSHGTAPALGIMEIGGSGDSDAGGNAKRSGKGPNPGKKNGRPTGSETTP